MKQLPLTIHEVDGNHRVALDRATDISKYQKQAVKHLYESYHGDLPPRIRAAMVHEADDMLDTIIRFAQCAKEELRTAYCRNGSVELDGDEG